MILERPWERFFREKMLRILSEKKSVVDIGGSLRIDASRNNRLDLRRAWILDLMRTNGVDYKIVDYVDTYHPDVVGDVQDLPFSEGSQEALICIAVLEHVENPIRAASELYRVLQSGGFCLIYVPFLYYYHAEEGYYGDYWRFTRDSIHFLFKPFSVCEVMPVRGAIETLIRLSPLGRFGVCNDFGYILDLVTGKLGSKQISGYYVFLEK